MQAGDIALFHPVNAVGWWISAFTRSRYCHVRLITDSDGSTVEANWRGALRGHVQDGDVIVNPPLTASQRSQIATESSRYVGVPYGFLDILALALAAFGIRAKWLRDAVGREDRLICSQLVDLAWTRAGFRAFTDGRLPQDVNPGDLGDLAQASGWPSSTYEKEQ